MFELFAAASENVFLRRQVDYNAATPTSRSRVTICLIAGRQFGTGAEVSGHFGPVSMMPKCLGSEVSRVRSVLTPFLDQPRYAGPSLQHNISSCSQDGLKQAVFLYMDNK